MPIPSSITDLQATESLNSPQGGDQVGGNIDNFLRAHASIIKRQFAKGADISSAGTLAVPADGSFFNVVKVVSAITNISDNFNGRIVYLKFAAGITLTHSASLIMPVGVSVTTELDDVCVFINDAPGIWRCVSYPRYAASNYAGAEPTVTWPYMTWADTATGLRKMRNAAGTGWDVIGTISLNVGADHASSTAPAVTFPYMTWGDTVNGLLKRRNATDTAWVTIGPLLSYGDSSLTFPVAPSSNPSHAVRQSQVFGIAQALTDVTGSIVSGASQVNTTGKPILVGMSGTSTTTSSFVQITLGGNSSAFCLVPIVGYPLGVSMVIPAGATYAYSWTLINARLNFEYR